MSRKYQAASRRGLPKCREEGAQTLPCRHRHAVGADIRSRQKPPPALVVQPLDERLGAQRRLDRLQLRECRRLQRVVDQRVEITFDDTRLGAAFVILSKPGKGFVVDACRPDASLNGAWGIVPADVPGSHWSGSYGHSQRDCERGDRKCESGVSLLKPDDWSHWKPRIRGGPRLPESRSTLRRSSGNRAERTAGSSTELASSG